MICLCRETLKYKTNEDVSAVICMYDEDNKKLRIPSLYLLKSAEYFKLFSQYVNLKIALDKDKKPIILCNSNVQYFRCTSIYNSVLQVASSGKLNDAFLKKLVASFNNVIKNEEIAEYLAKALVFDVEESSKLDLRDIATFGMNVLDNDCAEEIISAQRSNDIAINTHTLFQNECTDKFFLRLPTKSQLQDDEVDLYDLIPTRSEVCTPYANSKAYTSSYKDPSSGIPASMYPLIEGNPDNNGMQIQENEVDFYNTLDQWIRSNVKDEYGVDSLDVDDKDIVLDPTTSQYLEKLLQLMYSWHWSHNPNMPIYSPESQEDDGNTEASNFVFSVKAGEEFDTKIPAFYPLISFVRNAAIELGYKVWIDAVIQLGRWGTRKPTALYFKGYNYIFDLATNVRKPYIGSIKDYHLVQDSDGSMMTAKAVIVDNNLIVDNKYVLSKFKEQIKVLSIPVGIQFTEVYERDDGKKLILDNYCTILETVVALFRRRNGDSVDINPKGFTIDDDLTIHAPSVVESLSYSKIRADVRNNRNQLLRNPFNVSIDLMSVYLDLKNSAQNPDINLFEIIDNGIQCDDLEDNFEQNSFSSIDEFAEKYSSCIILNPDFAISLNVFKEIFPIIVKANSLYLASQKKDLETALNCYKEAMLEYDFNMFDVLGTKKSSFRAILGLSKAKDATGSLSLEKVPEEEPKEMSVEKEIEKAATVWKHSIFKEYSGEGDVYRVSLNDQFLGYFNIYQTEVKTSSGVKRKRNFIILADDFYEKYPDVRIEDGRLALKGILISVVRAMYAYIMDNEFDAKLEIKTFFENKEAMVEFMDRIKSV